MAAAVDLFYEKGYSATSLQDIADAVGMVKGGVYYYIETKGDLLYEITRRALELRAATIVEDEATANADPETRLRAFISRWMNSSRSAGPLSIVAETEFQRLGPRHLRAVIAQRDKYSAFSKSIIEAGIEAGQFDAWVDPTLATNSVFALMRNISLWLRPSGHRTFEEVVDWYAEFVLRGLRRQ